LNLFVVKGGSISARTLTTKDDRLLWERATESSVQTRLNKRDSGFKADACIRLSIATPATTKEIDVKLYSTTVPSIVSMMMTPPKLSFDPAKATSNLETT
jgi:hypothetical protein